MAEAEARAAAHLAEAEEARLEATKLRLALDEALTQTKTVAAQSARAISGAESRAAHAEAERAAEVQQRAAAEARAAEVEATVAHTLGNAAERAVEATGGRARSEATAAAAERARIEEEARAAERAAVADRAEEELSTLRRLTAAEGARGECRRRAGSRPWSPSLA